MQRPPQVAEAVIQAMQNFGNAGRGAHLETLNAARTIYHTREQLAELFHIEDPMRIAFASNATEALNTAIQGLFVMGDHVITSVCEHNSVLRPLYRCEEQGIVVSYLTADERGVLRYEELERLYQSNTRAVVITHASNVTGNVTDLKRVAEFCKAHKLLLVVDASQSAGNIPIDVKEMGIDVLCFTGHKGLLGPQGTGGIYVGEQVKLRPLKVGGSGIRSFDREHPKEMPTALEAGTLNGHGIAGLSAGLSYILEKGVDKIHQQEMALADQFVRGLQEAAGIRLYGDYSAPLRTAVVTLNIGDLDSGDVADWLQEDYDIAVRAGAHCAPRMHEALGTVEQGAVRFSFSQFNTPAEVEAGIRAVRTIAAEIL